MKNKKKELPFITQLTSKLQEAGMTNAYEGCLGDNSGMWIGVRKGDQELSISFTPDGEHITGTGVWKDVIQVVDTKKIF